MMNDGASMNGELNLSATVAYVFDKLIMKRNKGCRAVMAGSFLP